MKEIESIIRNRRTVRKFSDGRIERAKLEELVELAMWAPSSCNRQTIHFRFVEDPQLIRRVAKAAFNQPILHQPITLAVVCIDLARYRNVTLKNNLAPYLDAGLAMQNFLLAASESGVGCCVVAGRLDQEIIRETLDLPDTWLVASFVALGKPAETNPPPERDPSEFHVSYGAGEKVAGQTPYEEHIALRRRWARAGFNVTMAYRRPKEGVPVFRHAFEKLVETLVPGERCLVTNTVMGEFLVDDENVDHLAASDDEHWYLTEFLSSKSRVVPASPIAENADPPGQTYDRVISPFDAHFLGDADLAPFARNVKRWLKPGGRLSMICINGNSPWGLNHRFATLLGRDLSGLRYFGYETPVTPKRIARRFEQWFRLSSVETVSFAPPLNIWYLSPRMRQVPLGVARRFDFVGRMPMLRALGNVAFIDFKVKDRS